jgi:hypothetical protein
MIFDIPEIENLRSKHAGKAPHLLPGILQIDQLKEYEAEREILEQMFEFVPINKRQHLLQELLSDQIGKHLGAWFQLMLCELLVDAGQGDVKVEVNLLDNNPDFLIEMQSQSLVIEATSSLGNLVRNPRRDTENTIFGIFHGIQHPYVITGSISNVGSSISEIQLTAQLIEWIENHPNEGFSYKDHRHRPTPLELLQRPARRRPVLRRLRRAAHLPALPQDGRRTAQNRRGQRHPRPPGLAEPGHPGRRRAGKPLPPDPDRTGQGSGLIPTIFRKAQNKHPGPGQAAPPRHPHRRRDLAPASTSTSRPTSTKGCWRRTPRTSSRARASTSPRGRSSRPWST